MRPDSDCLRSAAEDGAAGSHQRFLEFLVAFLCLSVLAFLALLYLLGSIGSLPAPPITATYCIDEKFKFLAEQPEVEQSDLLAVGSSVTWRNLAMQPFVDRGIARRPLNAAPCYLHMDQVAFLTSFLLDHLDRVKLVVSVVAPRDFADCNEAERAFFSTDKAAAYVFHGESPLAIYASNFRPIPFIRDALDIAEKRSSPTATGPLFMGPYGSGPITGEGTWSAAPSFDDRCFAALSGFEALLAARGIRLALVSFPSSPAWLAEHDPDGSVTRTFDARLRASLTDERTLFRPAETAAYGDPSYFDYVHLNWPAAQVFSADLARWLADRGVAAGGG